MGEGPPCPCFAMARQQSGVYDKHIHQSKRQGKTKVAGVWDPHRRVDRPQIFHDYNHFMNAVHRSDQILATHTMHRKSMRWWKVFFPEGIDTAVVKSFIIFKAYQARFPEHERLQRPARYDLRDFRAELARVLP